MGAILRVVPAPTYFSTSFPATENPLSESGAWVHRAAAWQFMKSDAGFGQAAAYITEGLNDDNYARLDLSVFKAPTDDYEITATVEKIGVAGAEIELLARVQDTYTTIHCYELLVNTTGFCELVRWNGAMGVYTEITETNTVLSTSAGDRVRMRVVGINPVVVTVFNAVAANPNSWTQVFEYTDTDVTRKQSGQPGIGSFIHAASGLIDRIGWRDFEVKAL